MRFRDRADAGRRLADVLREHRLTDPVVLALPRGGVPVGHEVALALGAPLDVFVARKVGAPGRPELGIGAIAEGGGVVARDEPLRLFGISPARFDELVARERKELDRRVERYRGERPRTATAGRDVVLVDDGIATGVTAHAALLALREEGPRRLLLAAPTCAAETATALRRVADEVVCVVEPRSFRAVGEWYDRFDQTTDEEVLQLLAQHIG